jgi:hypothetical protein
MLREECGITVSVSTIHCELIRHGLTRKKAGITVIFQCTCWSYVFQMTKPAIERDEELRARFCLRMVEYAPEDLVFVNESACNRNTFMAGHLAG